MECGKPSASITAGTAPTLAPDSQTVESKPKTQNLNPKPAPAPRAKPYAATATKPILRRNLVSAPLALSACSRAVGWNDESRNEENFTCAASYKEITPAESMFGAGGMAGGDMAGGPGTAEAMEFFTKLFDAYQAANGPIDPSNPPDVEVRESL